MFLLQGRSGDCELTLGEDDGEITCVDEGIAIRFWVLHILYILRFEVLICFPEMFREPSVTSAAGEKYGAGELEWIQKYFILNQI